MKSPFTGLVQCGRCKSSMSIFSSPRDSNNKSKGYYHYFRCITREQKSKILCDNYNIRADLFEYKIVSYIKSLCNNKTFVAKLLDSSNDNLENKRVPLIAKRNKIQSSIDGIEKEMNNLVIALGKGTLPEIMIQKRFKELEKQRKEFLKEINQIEDSLDANYKDTYTIDEVRKSLDRFANTYDNLDFDEKCICQLKIPLNIH